MRLTIKSETLIPMKNENNFGVSVLQFRSLCLGKKLICV